MNVKEIFNDAIPIVQKFAPTIGAAIGGPVGLAAGYVIPVLANAFGIHPSDIAGLTQKILNDSDAQGKLEQVEVDHGDVVARIMDSVNNLANAEVNIKLAWK